jgi:hypothetical protein
MKRTIPRHLDCKSCAKKSGEFFIVLRRQAGMPVGCPCSSGAAASSEKPRMKAVPIRYATPGASLAMPG